MLLQSVLNCVSNGVGGWQTRRDGFCPGETNGLVPPPWVDKSWRTCIGWPEDPGDGGTSGVNRGEIGVKLKAIRRVLGLGGTAPPLPFPIPLG